ncbi:hypothetical protein CONLIGDRAFT_648145 [Coniochaeta ligniaria NRRL 30616]|uniref:Uncharacterized protein n=1 Tax=Coniochaeta ligniaria NRRL 30616 TaxID=1408157 RepID=A0A1J7ICS4_9PEZI|nr:hypothetical protein CONLIGDRAFT_648145 [Coniochaeta ligniaria NRRL 30616]
MNLHVTNVYLGTRQNLRSYVAALEDTSSKDHVATATTSAWAVNARFGKRVTKKKQSRRSRGLESSMGLVWTCWRTPPRLPRIASAELTTLHDSNNRTDRPVGVIEDLQRTYVDPARRGRDAEFARHVPCGIMAITGLPGTGTTRQGAVWLFINALQSLRCNAAAQSHAPTDNMTRVLTSITQEKSLDVAVMRTFRTQEDIDSIRRLAASRTYTATLGDHPAVRHWRVPYSA